MNFYWMKSQKKVLLIKLFVCLFAATCDSSSIICCDRDGKETWKIFLFTWATFVFELQSLTLNRLVFIKIILLKGQFHITVKRNYYCDFIELTIKINERERRNILKNEVKIVESFIYLFIFMMRTVLRLFDWIRWLIERSLQWLKERTWTQKTVLEKYCSSRRDFGYKKYKFSGFIITSFYDAYTHFFCSCPM